ncbi:DUF4169 family protein [Methylopila sp. M107]|uniref:DUF4169 family protein n=1 Tax=Methylopila sp. M107 TaxID=1101190 RepID=UPI000368AD0F|nr:DUF4169 family protein [Methylopila sp. M107]
MAEVVNLRLARKRKAREQSERLAAENRASFGRSKDSKAVGKAVEALDRRRHEGHRRENGGDDE